MFACKNDFVNYQRENHSGIQLDRINMARDFFDTNYI